MRNYDKIPVGEAITIADTLISLMIKGFENVGFRPKIKKEIEQLKDLAILQDKRIKSLEEKLM